MVAVFRLVKDDDVGGSFDDGGVGHWNWVKIVIFGAKVRLEMSLLGCF